MVHEVFPVGPLQCNCSIVGDETTGEAMVIDPGGDLAEIRARLAKLGWQVWECVPEAVSDSCLHRMPAANAIGAVACGELPGYMTTGMQGAA